MRYITYSGWQLVDAGAADGGCTINRFGVESCTHPSERSHHSAAIFGNDMIVYGGVSRWCTDYCEDVWSFNLVTLTCVFVLCLFFIERDDHNFPLLRMTEYSSNLIL